VPQYRIAGDVNGCIVPRAYANFNPGVRKGATTGRSKGGGPYPQNLDGPPQLF